MKRNNLIFTNNHLFLCSPLGGFTAYKAIEQFKTDHSDVCDRDPRFYLRLKRYRGESIERGARPRGTPVFKSNMRALASRTTSIPLERATDTVFSEPAGDLINRVAQPEFDMPGLYQLDDDMDISLSESSHTLLGASRSPAAVGLTLRVPPPDEDPARAEARALLADLSSPSFASPSPEPPPSPTAPQAAPQAATADIATSLPAIKHDSSSSTSSVFVVESSASSSSSQATCAAVSSIASQSSSVVILSNPLSQRVEIDLTMSDSPESSPQYTPASVVNSINSSFSWATLSSNSNSLGGRVPIDQTFPHTNTSSTLREFCASARRAGFSLTSQPQPQPPAPADARAPHVPSSSSVASTPVFGRNYLESALLGTQASSLSASDLLFGGARSLHASAREPTPNTAKSKVEPETTCRVLPPQPQPQANPLAVPYSPSAPLVLPVQMEAIPALTTSSPFGSSMTCTTQSTLDLDMRISISTTSTCARALLPPCPEVIPAAAPPTHSSSLSSAPLQAVPTAAVASAASSLCASSTIISKRVDMNLRVMSSSTASTDVDVSSGACVPTSASAADCPNPKPKANPLPPTNADGPTGEASTARPPSSSRSRVREPTIRTPTPTSSAPGTTNGKARSASRESVSSSQKHGPHASRQDTDASTSTSTCFASTTASHVLSSASHAANSPVLRVTPFHVHPPASATSDQVDTRQASQLDPARRVCINARYFFFS